MAEQESKNKAVVRRWVEEVLNKKKLDAFDEIFDERYVQPFTSIRSREEWKALVKKAFDDPKWAGPLTILEMIAEGDRVALRFKHPNGREQVSYYTFAKGKIVEDRYYLAAEVV